MMEWEVEYTDQFGDWYGRLSDMEQDVIVTAVEHLEHHGPALGRPLVDGVKGSRYATMKELRPPGGHIRILFTFDPRRTAILLIGGDKTNRWRSWYEEVIPIADHLYEEHLEQLRREENEHA